MGTQERRQREREEVRQKIMDAARNLFLENGYDAVTMRRIAEKIEYSPTAIYFHFRDKDDLFQAICRADFDSLTASFQAIARIEDPAERLAATGRAYAHFGLEHPNHYRLMFMTPPPESAAPDPHECEREDPERNAYAFLRQTVQAAMQAGCFKPELKDADLIAQTLWAGIHGVVSLRIALPGNLWIQWPEAESSVEVMLEALQRGLFRDSVASTRSAAAPRRSAGREGRVYGPTKRGPKGTTEPPRKRTRERSPQAASEPARRGSRKP